MTRRQLLPPFMLAAALAALCALALWLTGCGEYEPPAHVTIYGEVDAATWARVAEAIEYMPADPWPCVTVIHINPKGCPPDRAGCYWWDIQTIESNLAALPHEFGHAAETCAGMPNDHEHAAPWWRDVDGVR